MAGSWRWIDWLSIVNIVVLKFSFLHVRVSMLIDSVFFYCRAPCFIFSWFMSSQSPLFHVLIRYEYVKMSFVDISCVVSHVSRGLAILHWALQRKTSKGWVQRCCQCLAWHTGWNRMAPSLRRLLVKIYTVLTVHVTVRSYNLSYHPKRKYSSIHIAVTEAKKGIQNSNNII